MLPVSVKPLGAAMLGCDKVVNGAVSVSGMLSPRCRVKRIVQSGLSQLFPQNRTDDSYFEWPGRPRL